MNDIKNLPLVTIAMVTYNQEILVSKAIESVLAQGYPNFELIISDDCSKDKTWEIINSYNDPRIKVYKTPKNLYQYGNRNSVIEKANGKYLIFVDGDDLIYPHGLEYHVRLLEEFSECGYSTMHFFRNNMVYPVVINSYQFLKAEYFQNSFLGTSLAKIVFRTEALRKVGGFPLKYITSDDLLRLNIATEYPILITYQDPCWWRETPGQESGKINVVRRIKEYWLQTQEVLNNPKCPFSEEEKYYIRYKQSYSAWRQIIKLLIKLKWREAIEIYRHINFQIKFAFAPPKEKINRDPFPEYTISNPMKIDYSRNPYSNSYNKNE